MKELNSIQNPTVKKVVSYIEKSRDRKKDAVFVVEGLRENARAIQTGLSPRWLFYSSEFLNENKMRYLIEYREPDALIHECSEAVFEKISFRSGVPNVVGVYPRIDKSLAELEPKEKAFYLIVESVEKPGNLGAILRTANAAKVDAVIVANGVVDVFHPHVVRNSLGGFFDVPVVSASNDEITDFLSSHNIPCFVTYLEGAVPHFECDFREASAIVMGAEDTGVSQHWIDVADALVKIPMSGVVDSLNVSVAAGIMLFEVVRQRS
ncbi:MAG: RNA methyltransferase [Bacteroidetes bacterium]|nr:MAG: RNA methyltransferase [Bacteroidota bacterium]